MRVLVQEVHEDELYERHRVREVSPSLRNRGDALHERVDHNSLAAASGSSARCLGSHIHVKPHRVIVDPTKLDLE